MTHLVGLANSPNQSTTILADMCCGFERIEGARNDRKAFCWSQAHMSDADEIISGARRTSASPRPGTAVVMVLQV